MALLLKLHQEESEELAPSPRGGDTFGYRAFEMNGLNPDITAAEVVRHGVLRLTFADGLSGEVDVLDRMRGPVFEDALTPKGFAKVKADPETGTVVWPGGADLAPDTLYARVQSGAWPESRTAV